MYVICYALLYQTVIILPPYPLPPNVYNILCIVVSYNIYFTSVSFTEKYLLYDTPIHSILYTIGGKGYGGKTINV
jgi:hypothetical protein